MKSDDSDNDNIERKVSHKVKKHKAATKQDRTCKKAKREVTSKDSNSDSDSDSELDSESESTPLKGKNVNQRKPRDLKTLTSHLPKVLLTLNQAQI